MSNITLYTYNNPSIHPSPKETWLTCLVITMKFCIEKSLSHSFHRGWVEVSHEGALVPFEQGYLSILVTNNDQNLIFFERKKKGPGFKVQCCTSQKWRKQNPHFCWWLQVTQPPTPTKTCFFFWKRQYERDPWKWKMHRDALNTQGPKNVSFVENLRILIHPRNSGRHVLIYTPGINDTSSEINLSHQSLSKGNFILPAYIFVVKEKRILLPAPWLHLPSPFIWVLEKANLEIPTPTNHGGVKVPPGTSRWNVCTNLCRALLKS